MQTYLLCYSRHVCFHEQCHHSPFLEIPRTYDKNPTTAFIQLIKLQERNWRNFLNIPLVSLHGTANRYTPADSRRAQHGELGIKYCTWHLRLFWHQHDQLHLHTTVTTSSSPFCHHQWNLDGPSIPEAEASWTYLAGSDKPATEYAYIYKELGTDLMSNNVKHSLGLKLAMTLTKQCTTNRVSLPSPIRWLWESQNRSCPQTWQ